MGGVSPDGGGWRFTSVVAHPESARARSTSEIRDRCIALWTPPPSRQGRPEFYARRLARAKHVESRRVCEDARVHWASSMHGDVAQRAVELAEALLREARAQQTADEHAQARKL